MKDFLEININSKRYILIDEYKYKGDKLFRFGSLLLDDEIFCKKENEEYIPIKDEFEIAIIRNKYGFINLPYYFDFKNYAKLIKKVISKSTARSIQKARYILKNKEPFSTEEADKIRKEQIENFKKIKEIYNLDINLEEITKKINNVKLYKANIINGARGYYKIISNNIVYKKNMLEEDSIENKKTKLHEYIHAMTGKKLFLFPMMNGMIEGKTENLAQSMYNENTSSKDYYSDKDKFCSIQYNFSESTSYMKLVSFVQQMEYVTGKKAHESILKGDLSFEYEFAKKYGVPLLVFMIYRMERIFLECYGFVKNVNKYTGRNFDEVQYIKETQDILMEKVFDKEFESVENIEDAKKYLEKLRNFETVRGKIRTYKGEEFIKIEDKSFEEYYNKKFVDLLKMLEEKGMSRESINGELEQYQYMEQEYKNAFTKEKELEHINEELKPVLESIILRNNHMIDINNYDVKVFRVSNNNVENYNYFILEKGTKEGYFIKRDISGKTDKIFENISEEEKYLQNGDMTEKIKSHKDNGCEVINIEINPEIFEKDIIEYLEEKIKKNKKRIVEYEKTTPLLSNMIRAENEQIVNLLKKYYKENEVNEQIDNFEENEEER